MGVNRWWNGFRIILACQAVEAAGPDQPLLARLGRIADYFFRKINAKVRKIELLRRLY